MKRINHRNQQKIWDREHTNPYVLKQMDSSEPSSGVKLFYNWLKRNNIQVSTGIELGCGKGRNVIWLAQQGIEMTGIDFSPFAIREATKRVKKDKKLKVAFFDHDATQKWPFQNDRFDFTIDCFATTDIETQKGREFAVKEMIRILKPEGYILVYVMSTDDEFHKQMVKQSPANEKNAFIHPKTGKFEKIYDREEILKLYHGLDLLDEKRIPKTTEFFGNEYSCNHYWMIFQKKN